MSLASRNRWLALLAIALVGCATAGGRPGAGAVPAVRQAGDPRGEEEGGAEFAGLASLPSEELVRRGAAYLRQGSYTVARLHFSQALRATPGSVPVLLGLGDALSGEGHWAEAERAYRHALTLDPETRSALLGVGRARARLGDAQGAADSLSRARELSPDDPVVLTELALALETLGEEARAEELHRRVTELRPQSASALNNLGFNYLLQNRYPEAAATLEQALRLGPGDRRVQNNLAVACGMMGNDDRALTLFEEAVGRAGAYNNLGYVRMVRGDWEGAERAFRTAMEESPSFYPKARDNLTRLGDLLREKARTNVQALQREVSTGEAGADPNSGLR